jgi:hypothetical protein
MDNFWDIGATAYVVFEASQDPDTQVVTLPEQQVDDGNPATDDTASGVGTYDQCTKTLKIATKYQGSEWRYEFVKK